MYILIIEMPLISPQESSPKVTATLLLALKEKATTALLQLPASQLSSAQ
ncbi:hypothetical protein SANA_25390 [Gottschalkiaceae bacterium SANA]|nr:hypothetical protein SANA_25390 [Gottschalkiaceae bacterium SANA]